MKECLVCSSLFIPHIRNPYQIYCSKSCGTKASNRRAVETGRKSISGKIYRERHPDRKKQQDREYLNKSRYGGNQFNVLERDGYACTQCGSQKRSSLVVHHIDEVVDNTLMENLITLCRACHAKHHHAGELNVKYKQISKEDIEKSIQTTSTLDEAASSLGITRSTLLIKRRLYGMPNMPRHRKNN